jgi:beta-glucosidase
VTADYAGAATLTLTNNSGTRVDTTWSATLPAGVTVTPATGTVSLAPGASQTIPITVAATGTDSGVQTVDFALASTVGDTTVNTDTPLTVNVAYQSLTQAFNNVGVSDDSTPTAGNFDGSGNSFSVEALAAAGITSQEPISHDGASFTWPDIVAGEPDNMQVAGQTIAMQGSGSYLSFLLAGTHGTATGTGVITYTDGSTAPFTLNSDNWTVAPAGAGTGSVTGTAGNDILAITAHWNPTSSPDGDYQVAVFGYQVPLDQTKTVAYVTMPATMSGGDGSGLQTTHIFAMAIAP